MFMVQRARESSTGRIYRVHVKTLKQCDFPLGASQQGMACLMISLMDFGPSNVDVRNY